MTAQQKFFREIVLPGLFPIATLTQLTAMGTPETDRNIANKISRGGFTAAFFIECLVAIGVRDL